MASFSSINNNNNDNSTATLERERGEQTFLRVKRRRNERPPSTIRLELLGGWNVRRNDDFNFNNIDNIENDHNNNNIFSSSSTIPAVAGAAAASSSAAAPMEHGLGGGAFRSSSTATLAHSQHSSNMSASTSQTTNVTSNVTNRNINLHNNNDNSDSRRYNNTAAAIWKRVEDLEGDSSSSTTMASKRCRVVDAVLENDGDRSSKRRKLTVIGQAKNDNNTCGTDEGYNDFNSYNKISFNSTAVAANKKRKQHYNNMYRVLDPVTHLVDDSLTMVHAGDRSVSQHYNFITTDPRLATQSRKWSLYCNRGGNLLHACAHWNDVELAHDLLRKSLSGLADAIDEDGRTPYEIAQICDHPSIMEVLEAFGADTTNFVYDIFVPEDIAMSMPVEESTNNNKNNNNESITLSTSSLNQQQKIQPQAKSYPSDTTSNNNNKRSVDEDIWNPLEKKAINTSVFTSNGHHFSNLAAPRPGVSAADDTTQSQQQQQQQQHDLATMFDASRLLELQGGVGYWTEEGELILEVEPHHMMMGMAEEYGMDPDADEGFGDYDYDSNDEQYGGNDYPDEESWEEEFLCEEPCIDDEDGDDDDSLLVYGGGGSGIEDEDW